MLLSHLLPVGASPDRTLLRDGKDDVKVLCLQEFRAPVFQPLRSCQRLAFGQWRSLQELYAMR